jgi:hypothetical protein
MRRPLLLLSILSLGLLGADCNFEDLIDTDALGLPDPCDQTEISCNGIDEDCDGIDDCAEVPPGATDMLALVASLVALDCDGLATLLDSALAPLDLDPEAACPARTLTAEGPFWDGETECKDFNPDDGTCTRSGAAETAAWAGGCDRGDVTVGGALSLASGTLTITRTTDTGASTVTQSGTLFTAEEPGMWLSRGDADTHHRVAGLADRTRTTTETTTDEVTLQDIAGCSLSLDLQAEAAPPPLVAGASSTLLRVQSRRDVEDGEVSWNDGRNGNATLEMEVDGVLGRFASAWVRDQEGGGDPAECSQSGSFEVWAVGEDEARLWSVRLDLDAPCSPCGNLLVDGEFAGVWCAE